MSINKHLIGDTIRITWVSSDITPSALFARIFDGDSALIDSATMTSSGNGHYYYDYTLPNSIGYYVSETLATINGLPYKRRTKFKAVTGEVD